MNKNDPNSHTPAHIFQIFYSEETRNSLDPGFLPLDNSSQRHDWREYWPIRKFLLESTLDDNAYYGFFSPKFKLKTGLDSSAVYSFLTSLPSPVDVVSFSPYFDQAAFHLNTLEQAEASHADVWPTWESVAPLIIPGIDPHTLVMDSRHSIFCNFFLARPIFWAAWLEKCELIFAAAEHNTGPLYNLLNRLMEHDNGLITTTVSTKVFVVERIASLLLASNPAWRIANFNPIKMAIAMSPITRFSSELVMLDALKHSANTLGHDEYLQTYWNLRAALVKAING